MEDIIKNILFYTATISGSICIVLLFLCATYRCFCIFLDHCKNANVLRQCLIIYINQKRPELNIKPEQIKFSKQRIYKNKKED